MKSTLIIAAFLSIFVHEGLCNGTWPERMLIIPHTPQQEVVIAHDPLDVDPLHEEQTMQDIDAFVGEHRRNTFYDSMAALISKPVIVTMASCVVVANLVTARFLLETLTDRYN